MKKSGKTPAKAGTVLTEEEWSERFSTELTSFLNGEIAQISGGNNCIASLVINRDFAHSYIVIAP